MGKQFSWSELINPPIKKENLKKLSCKRTAKQIKECLLNDQLFWMQKNKKVLPQTFEKIDKNWYCQVIKGAKYSRVGDYFVDINQIKCVKIERPDINSIETIKPRLPGKKSIIKREVVIKKQHKEDNRLPSYDTNRISISPNVDDHSSFGSSESGSILCASEIVRQAQQFLPKLEISPSCFSNPITVYQKTQDKIDVLNYDFSFTSPLIKS